MTDGSGFRNGKKIAPNRRTKFRRPDRDYYLERKYPSYGNLSPRDISSRAAKEVCDEGRGVGPGGRGVYLDFADAIKRLGEETISERYGNLFEIYEKITGEDAYKVPMRIYPAVHYTMGGLWVDYNLMSNVPGLFVIGEANFSDHGANRLGASALMQGLADGYFVLPYTLPNYLAGQMGKRPSTDRAGIQRCRKRCAREDRETSENKRQLLARFDPSRARHASVGQMRHGPKQSRTRRSARKNSRAARKVLARSPCAGRWRRFQSIARTRRSRSPIFSSSPS